ncbi:DinB family protein [Zeaxanthinibacter enoshimensis]|uniref:DinB family protein n=1 Tax=Zeaxanthinibacter enoshimensis TaxID=392009 RepID=A0A4R6TSN0_9FLAO|nr:DinB family protein [Zeaxanthinibacter enoshimensis]TDQ31480.1 DinB family protein [Zeaxanthinibacter enoshimensis]
MKVSDLKEGDFHPYYQAYIDTLGEAELMQLLRSQIDNFPKFIQSIPADKWLHSYELGKWTIAEVLLHVLDSERVFQYRALRIARQDTTPLPGFEHDAYVPVSGANNRTKESVINEYRAVRNSSITLFENLGPEELRLKGTASNSPVSVAALGFLICGHQKHHRNVIRAKYL